jgi:hypothetical protein
MFEIEDYANTQARNAQIIQHQPTFMVGDLVDDFCVYDYRIKRDQVRNEEADLVSFVEHIKRRLLSEWNFPQ